MPPKKRQRYIIGVDLGGTNIVVGAMSADGKQHFAMRSIPTAPELGAESVADRIVGLIEGVLLDTLAQTDANRRDFIGVGIGAPGPLVREETASMLPSLVNGKLDAITAETVYKAAHQGDAVASEIVRDTARYLGVGIANLLNTLNADVVVVAGGVTQAGDALFLPLQAE